VKKPLRDTDGLFMGIGHKPNTDFLKEYIDLDDHGFIKTQGKHPDTNIFLVYSLVETYKIHITDRP
jgi:thioredoxin reductase (NADPH)